MKQLIKTNKLEKRYKRFQALKDVSINVNENDIYGLIGKNGAGKTTLFKVIMGLTNKSAGDLEINGNSNLNKARKSIGFMIGASFFSYANAFKNIEYYRKLKNIKDKNETKRVLEIVGLDKEKKPFKSYSLGMKQRLGLANALLGNPEIIILDEPINGLDPQGIADIRNTIKAINKEYNTTFVISSHILSELDLIATKFGFIDSGVLIKEISHMDLHQATSKSLIVEVDDLEKTKVVLEEDLNTKNYKIVNNKIILNDYLEESFKVSKAIVTNNINLFTIKKHEMSLEEYYINLIGGINND